MDDHFKTKDMWYVATFFLITYVMGFWIGSCT